ncbi:MAG TPA: type 1 glutamine amidotransferase family protein [Gemmatimonadales bacterium]|nr:type 1 glutamine amidotransferase family protein [Gemmatimonadales bacterium]
MARQVHVLVLDGFADWEPALALCELRQQGGYEIVAAGLTGAPVKSRGGLRVTPDIPLAELDPARSELVILPGGDSWETGTPAPVAALLPRLVEAGVPVAAICAATVALARTGLLAGRRHTSNGREYLAGMAGDYPGREGYVDELAVTDGRLITASGAAPVEFAREILQLLGIYGSDELPIWFRLFKYGELPATA